MQLAHTSLRDADRLRHTEGLESCNYDFDAGPLDRVARESWDIYSCWKEQLTDRFGAGTPSPSIPQSQRAYDGDNWHDYCEVWVG
ncbi:MAG: hypothetical protein NXI32_11260 [bacterium]|nr:hypothetical protein [bacterium]